MASTSPRISRRHLLALTAFLVPLAALALLGRAELQRSGELADAALEGEAREFLARARDAIGKELDSKLDEAARAAAPLLAEHSPAHAVVRLRESFPALRSVLTMDAQGFVHWPSLPGYQDQPPLAEPTRNPGAPGHGALQAADLLLTHGREPEAIQLLQPLADTLAKANYEGQNWRAEIGENELVARMWLARTLRRQNQPDAARTEYERARAVATRLERSFPRGSAAQGALDGLTIDLALAELGPLDARVRLMAEIAENRRGLHPDGLLAAIAERLADGVPAEAAEHAAMRALLAENAVRADTRTFARSYVLMLKDLVARRRSRLGEGSTAPVHVVATIGDETLLLDVRGPGTPMHERWRSDLIALHFDLGKLLGPVLHAFADAEGTFLLAVADAEAEDVAIVPPPPDVPRDYAPQSIITNDLLLRAFPADPTGLAKAAADANRQRGLLLLAVFVTALGGALWSWRAVSRESELAALKVDLVSRVSHELKTPLALIRMYGETLGLGRARDPDQAADFGRIISRESERLTALIQRILDFSRQQAGTLQYSPQPHDLGQMLRRIATDYAPHLESRGVLLVDDLPHGITVRCDASACESAIVNLLENAAKYGVDNQGEHEVELVLRAANGVAVVEVLDRGRGIPDGEHERVFAGFHRASNAGEVRGAGLGLSLVRHFARAHGGDAIALPRDGGGTIVRLTLPLVGADAIAADVPPADRASP